MAMKVSSIAVFNEDGKLLMGKRADNGKWTLPGGKAEGNESPEETALRELREEAGIEPEVMGYLGVGAPGKIVVHAFKTTVPNGTKTTTELDPDGEIKERWQWVDVSDGVPEHIKGNLHAPRNVTLGLLGLMPRQPEPPAAQRFEDSPEIELSKSDKGISYRAGASVHNDLLPVKYHDAQLIVEDHPAGRIARVLRKGEELASLTGEVIEGVGHIVERRIPAEHEVLLRSLRNAWARDMAELMKNDEQQWTPHHALTHPALGINDRVRILREAPAIDEQSLGLALSMMARNPTVVSAILSRPDMDSDYLRRAADIAGRAQLAYTLHPSAAGPVWRALAENPRTPSDRLEHVANWLGNSQHRFEPNGPDKAEASLGALLQRPDLSPQDFAKIVVRQNSQGSGGRRDVVQREIDKSPERYKALTDAALTDDSRLLEAYKLRFSPEQMKRIADDETGFSHHALVHAMRTQPEDFTDEQLNNIWDRSVKNRNIEWSPQAIARLPVEKIKAELGDSGYFSAAGTHPQLTEEDFRALPEYNRPSDAVLHPNVGPELRKQIWDKTIEARKNAIIDRVDPALLSDYLKRGDPYWLKSAIKSGKLLDRKDLPPDFWEEHLKPGAHVRQMVDEDPNLAARFIHLGGGAARAMVDLTQQLIAEKKVVGIHPDSLERAHPDYIRELHARGIMPENEKGRDVVLGRLHELGLAQPNLITFQTGSNRARQLKATVESMGGSVPNRVLKERGIDLGAMGLNRLLDAKGNLTSKALDQHITAMPSETWAHSMGTWKGKGHHDINSQTHGRAAQKVFQLNLTPDRLQQLRNLGLGDLYHKVLSDKGGHPIAAHHGVGWVRYTEKPDGVHIDEIQSDFGHNLAARVKESPAAAQKLGIEPKHVAGLVNFLWGKQEPGEVLHEAFLQHLRNEGKAGTQVHMWQLKPKAAIAGQDDQKEMPVHLRQTYDKQPKRMGYGPGTYGEIKTQGTGKLKGQPTWKQTLKREEPLKKSADYAAIRNLPREEVKERFEAQRDTGFADTDFLRHAQLSPEEALQASRELDDIGELTTVRGRELGALMSNPHLAEDTRKRIWDGLKTPAKTHAAFHSHLGTDYLDDLLKQPDLRPRDADLALRTAAGDGGVGPSQWLSWLKPEHPVHKLLAQHPHLINAIGPALRDRHVATAAQPLLDRYVDEERAGNIPEFYSGWGNSMSDQDIHAMAARGKLPQFPGAQVWDERLHELGLGRDERVQVGNRELTVSHSEGPPGHDGRPSKVLQVNLGPGDIEEIKRQRLLAPYYTMLGSNQQALHHPARGLGWVQYTEGSDGIHVDGIRTSLAVPTLGPRAPTQDEHTRLQRIYWGGQQPGAVLHEALMQHLRTRAKPTEVHAWERMPGAEPDRYGVLETQSNAQLRGKPTYKLMTKSFGLDAESWMADNAEMLNKGAGKHLWGLAAAAALHVMPMNDSKEHAPPTPPEVQNVKDVPGFAPQTHPHGATVAVKTQAPKWSAHGLHDDLYPIAHLESSFGLNVDHARNPTDWTTAFGALGMKPQTAHFEYNRSKALRQLYPGLQNEEDFTHRFKNDPHFYNTIANSHFSWLKSSFGGDAEKAAAAWRYGQGSVQRAASIEDLDAEGYVKKYRALAARHAARQIVTQPAAARAAINAAFTKNEKLV